MPRTQPAKAVENKAQKAGDSHLMPGLINPICNAFDHPKRHLTTRGIARQMGIAETFAVTAILRDTRRELVELRGMVARQTSHGFGLIVGGKLAA